MQPTTSPLKIFNDPVHGFIEVPRGTLLQLVDHPIVQRLRNIRQLGLTCLVYPGAMHTRFNHALGALHLVQQALTTLREKGVSISEEEAFAVQTAILLHDIGHGPFSHGLEASLLRNMSHEDMSLLLMQRLNQNFEGELELALRIFRGEYDRPFLRQLIASQLDMDRMDYLMRDSFFTGVQEGIVGTDRIIKTLNVHDGELVVEEKGIYSVEKFIVARRLMYWQVYLHKTALSAELMMIEILDRAREVLSAGGGLPMAPALGRLLRAPAGALEQDQSMVDDFLELGDEDILAAIKQWRHAADPVLADLAARLLDRRLFKLRFFAEPQSEDWVRAERERLRTQMNIDEAGARHYVLSGRAQNLAYKPGQRQPIRILFKDGRLRDLADAADVANIRAMAQEVTKYYVATLDYPVS